MEQSSAEKQLRIRKQFDSFCKTLLKNEMIDYERARSYQQKHEVLILSILVDTFISKISFPMQPGPEIGSISDA